MTEALRLWPPRVAGHDVKPIDRGEQVGADNSYGDNLNDMLAMQMAENIAKLFYDYYPGGMEGAETKVSGEEFDVPGLMEDLP